MTHANSSRLSPSTTSSSALPVAVIGAGPIGLAAAAHLILRGETPVVLEAGSSVGSAIRQWGHVRLFSPWKYLVDPASQRLLEAAGWAMPGGDVLPTGRELVERYLAPLAARPQIASTVKLGHRVTSVSRHGLDKVKSAERDETPFELVVQTGPDREERLLARAVIDASGTWSDPNPMGASGVAVPGERELARRISYRIPDVVGEDRSRYAGKRTLVVGSGHSAFNALLDLARLALEAPGTQVVWAIRRAELGLMFGGGQRDALNERGKLGDRLRAMVDDGGVTLIRGFRTTRLFEVDAAVMVEGDAGHVLGPFDELIVTTGFRPDLALTREVRLGLDPWLESPLQLAPLIDPNVHSCGTVYPHGAVELAHPEKNFYTVGMKSYGRAPTFLLLTGYEQVRSVVAQLVGDEAGAREVQLVLPETGVCSTDLAAPCCGAGDSGGAAPIAGSCGVAAACASPAAAAGAGLSKGCCG